MSTAAMPISSNAPRTAAISSAYWPLPRVGMAKPGRHSSVSTISSGYSMMRLNMCGAISPVRMPPIMPPNEIHM